MNAVLRSRQQSVAARPAERTDALVICNDDSLLIELARCSAITTASTLSTRSPASAGRPISPAGLAS